MRIVTRWRLLTDCGWSGLGLAWSVSCHSEVVKANSRFRPIMDAGIVCFWLRKRTPWITSCAALQIEPCFDAVVVCVDKVCSVPAPLPRARVSVIAGSPLQTDGVELVH